MGRKRKADNGGASSPSPGSEASVAVMSAPITAGAVIDPVAQAHEFKQTMDRQRHEHVSRLMQEYKQGEQHLQRIGKALLELGEEVPGQPGQPAQQATATRTRVQRTPAQPKAAKAKNGVGGAAPDGRSKSGVNKTAMVLSVVAKIAGNRQKAAPSGALLDAARKLNLPLQSQDFSTGLQALRRATPPKIDMIPNPNGGKRGGLYFAL